MRNTGAALKALIDPKRALREAEQALEQTPSMGNRLALAQGLLNADRAAETLPHFEACAQGLFANDPEALAGLARTQWALGQSAAAWQTLGQLQASQPERQTGELALLYAELAAVAAPTQAEAASSPLHARWHHHRQRLGLLAARPRWRYRGPPRAGASGQGRPTG